MSYFNSFLFESKSSVKNLFSKDNFIFAEFEETIFYPGGGGQPHDTGSVRTDTFYGEVIEVFKKQDNKENEDIKEKGDNKENDFSNDIKIIHKIKPVKGSLSLNETVELILNKDRRINLIKMHTGEHILFKCLEKTIGNLKLSKIDLDEQESSLFIETYEKLTWNLLFKAEELANKIIKENREIIEKEYPKTDSVIMEKIRIKPERIKSDKVRVIEIKDFDYSACTGTHAQNTGFVETLIITKFNQDKKGYEIRFTTDKNYLFEMSKISREASSILETDIKNTINIIKKLKEDYESYKEKYREISYKAMDNYKIEEIKNIKKIIRFIYNISENIEKKQLIDKINEIKEKNKEKTLICFINKIRDKDNKEKAEIILSATEELEINVPELLKKTIGKYNGKGGGKDKFAIGIFDARYIDNVLNEIKVV